MASYLTEQSSPAPAEVVFDDLADFVSIADWDPSVVAARRLTPEPIGLGSRFHVEVKAGKPYAFSIAENELTECTK